MDRKSASVGGTAESIVGDTKRQAGKRHNAEEKVHCVYRESPTGEKGVPVACKGLMDKRKHRRTQVGCIDALFIATSSIGIESRK